MKRAGIATFELPPEWVDLSSYRYATPDRAWRIDVLIDSNVEEDTAREVLRDRLETAEAIVEKYRLVEEGEVDVAGLRGVTATYDSVSDGRASRTRALVTMPGAGRSIVIVGTGPRGQWGAFEPVWDRIVSSLQIGDS